MTDLCEQLDAFVDGELSDEEAAAFRHHLATCRRCPATMRDVLAITARVRGLPPNQLVVGTERPRAKRWRWVPAFAALTALLLVVLLFARGEQPVALAAPTRAIEGRLSHPLLAAHRPYDAARSGSAAQAAVPLAALARLEERGDRHGVAAAWLQRGELGQAEATLRGLEDSADVLSDRAALALARREAAEALRLTAEALRVNPSHRPARWNRALALRALGLELLSAQELVALAAEDEPAWAEEARLRAAALEEAAGGERGSFERLRTTGEAMIAGGPVIDETTARAHPGLSRLYFYDAVRAAPDRQRLEGLRPLAAALDGVSGRTELQALLDRIKEVDPRLAADYLRLVRKESPPPDAQTLLATAQRAGRTDTALGVLLLAGLAASEPDRYRALARQSDDPWFELLAAQTEARGQASAGEWARAEATLTRLLQRCPVSGVEYRCGLAAVQLAQQRITQHRLDEAEPVLAAAERFVRAAGDFGTGLQVLALRAEAARLADALVLAEATLREYRLRAPDSCATWRFVDVSLAAVLFQRGASAEARAALASAPDCGEPLPLQAALLLADLQRFGGEAAETARARTALEARRQTVEAPLVETVLGRLELSTGDAQGRARLEAVIARPASGADAERARGYAFSTLMADAASRGDFGRLFQLAAQELEVEVPSRCAVVAALDDERWVTAALGPGGELAGRLERVPLPPGPVKVSAELLSGLGACEHITVLARPPVQGRAGLLPPTLAWSYRTRGVQEASQHAPRRVIVTEVVPPASLGLAPLAPYRGDTGGAHVLRGAAATPSAVLAAARTATELQLHVHGSVGGALPSATRLVLSEEADGRYALTAEAIRAARLEGAPTVVLAACDSGDVAAYLHQAWGLPQAFRAAGARAVFAASGALPDLSTAAFFDAVLARIRAGAAPSVALRDERLQWSARGEQWSQEIVLFE